MIAVVVVRGGALPAGGDETVAEAGGRAMLVGSGTAEAAAALNGIATHITLVERSAFHPSAIAQSRRNSASSVGRPRASVAIAQR